MSLAASICNILVTPIRGPCPYEAYASVLASRELMTPERNTTAARQVPSCERFGGP